MCVVQNYEFQDAMVRIVACRQIFASVFLRVAGVYSLPEPATKWSIMRFAIILKLLGVLLMIFSTFMLPPIFVALFYGDGATHAFMAISALCA